MEALELALARPHARTTAELFLMILFAHPCLRARLVSPTMAAVAVPLPLALAVVLILTGHLQLTVVALVAHGSTALILRGAVAGLAERSGAGLNTSMATALNNLLVALGHTAVPIAIGHTRFIVSAAAARALTAMVVAAVAVLLRHLLPLSLPLTFSLCAH